MKKILRYLACFALIAFCCMLGGFITPSIAKADVVWVPPENDFFLKMLPYCVSEDRVYTVNNEDGCSAYTSPVSEQETQRFDYGDKIYISYTYLDEDSLLWGMQETSRNGAQWIQMSDLKVVYDHIEFKKEHASELKQYDGCLADDTTERKIVFWQYPNVGFNSGSVSGKLSDLTCSYLYEDENGYKWTYVSYYCHSSGWIFISDPSALTIPKEPAITPSPSPGPSPVVTTAPGIVRTDFKIVDSWPGGFIGQIDVTNSENYKITDWTLKFKSPYKIESLWGADMISQSNGVTVVRQSAWDVGIDEGTTKSFNFVVTGDYHVGPEVLGITWEEKN